MANATQRVAKAYRDYRSDTVRHSYGTLSSQLQLYTNAHLGINAAGYLQKFDDTQALRYYGLILDVENFGGSQGPKLPSNGTLSGTQGDGSLDMDVKQAKRFELSITSVAITDIGRLVYALDDQTGTLDPSATTYANVYGVVTDLVYANNPGSPVANIAVVTPLYDVPTGSRIAAVYAASGAMLIKAGLHVITKSGVAAMTLADPTSGLHDGLVMRIQSATASAHTVDNSAGSGFNAGGSGTDVGTFGGAKGDGFEITAYGGKWLANYLRNVTLG